MKKKNDKRSRLVTAAHQLFQEKGFQTTTLAMIAERAGVPLGNVYYYFKSKDSLMVAVLQKELNDLNEITASLAGHSTQRERLKGFIEHYASRADEIALYGHSLVRLSQDLAYENEAIKAKLGEITKTLMAWINHQFIGLAIDHQTQAQCFLQRLFGIMSVAVITKDTQYVKDYCQRLVQDFSL